MKIIDLLNKIANGEEVPKHIRFGDINYYYNEEYKTYEHDKNVELYKWTILGLCLNDEVEILEEEKEIPEKLKLDLFTKNDVSYYVCKKINELIDYLKSKGE